MSRAGIENRYVLIFTLTSCRHIHHLVVVCVVMLLVRVDSVVGTRDMSRRRGR